MSIGGVWQTAEPTGVGAADEFESSATAAFRPIGTEMLCCSLFMVGAPIGSPGSDAIGRRGHADVTGPRFLGLGQGDGQDAMREARRDLGPVDAVGQRDG